MNIVSPATMKRMLIVIVVCAAIAVVVGGGALYWFDKQRTLAHAEESLQAIADLKARNVAEWRDERLADAAVLSESPFLREKVMRFLAIPLPEELEQMRVRLQSLREYYHYDDVLIVSPLGEIRFSMTGRKGALEREAMSALSASLADKRPKMSELFLSSDNTPPHCDLVAPIVAADGVVSCAVVLQCDAGQFLYKQVHTWPTPSASAEVLLVRREGDCVLFLNELRHRPDTALKLRIPLSQRDVPAVMAVMGTQGIVWGRDYRGVAVLSALEPVPDSPWFLVAKIDQREALAGWRTTSLLILAAIFLLVAGLGLLSVVMFQRESRQHCQTLYRSELQRRQTETRYATTLMGIGDGVIVTDAKGNVELMNPVAETLTGWTLEEARGKPLSEIFRIVNETTRKTVENPVAEVIAKGVIANLANHTILVARDGTERPIADSGAPIRNEQGELQGVVLVFRDQSAERANEMALLEREEMLRIMTGAASSAFLMMDQDGRIVFYNPAAEQIFGWTREEAMGKDLHSLLAPNQYHTAYQRGIERFRESGEGSAAGETLELRALRKNGAEFPIEISLSSVHMRGAWYDVSIIRDITERKRGEELLRESEKRFMDVLHASSDAILLIGDKMFVDCNDAAVLMLGYASRDQLLMTHPSKLSPPKQPDGRDSLDKANEIMQTAFERGFQRFEWFHRRANGEDFPVEVSLTPISYQGKTILHCLWRDVTALRKAEELLRASEEKYRALVETTGTGYLILDSEGRVVDANAEYVRLTGHAELRDILGKSVTEWTAEYEKEKNATAIARCVKDGFIKDLVIDYVDGNGRITPVEISATVDKIGASLRIISLCRDITVRKRAEAAIVREVQRTSSLIALNMCADRNVRDLMDVVTEDAIRLTGSTIGYLATLNEDESELTMQYWSKSAHDSCAVPDIQITYRVDKTGLWGEAVRQRRPVITNDYAAPNPFKRGVPEGHVPVVRHMNIPVFDGDRIVAVAGVGNKPSDYDEGDVRQLQLLMQGCWQIMIRKKAEEALRQSEERHRTLFRGSHDAIMTIEPPSWGFTSGNPACVAMFGAKDEADLTSYGPWELSPEYQPGGRSSGEKAKEMIETAMREGSYFFEWTHKRIGGEEFPATVLLTRLEIGDHAFLQATVRDITKQKQMEMELNQAQKLESIGRLAAGIAHEINTPTQYVGDNIEFLQIAYGSLLDLAKAVPAVIEAGREGPIPPPLLSKLNGLVEGTNVEYMAEQVPRAIEQSLEGIGHIATIVQAMKEFSHPGVAEKTSVDLNECIRSTVTVSHNEWKYLADIELDLDESLPQVLCLPGEFNQAILNMIVNAAHAIGDVVAPGAGGGDAEQKGRITIRSRQDGAWAEVRIADTGCGIPEGIRERIFDPFFTTKEVGRGTGQGLAIVRNIIVDKHRGTLSVESEVGKGTTFIIRLPFESVDTAGESLPSDDEIG